LSRCRVFPRQTKNCVRGTQYQSSIKTVGGECDGNLWGEGEAVTEKLGARGGEAWC
jgi:hypothetical protein